VDKWIVSLNPVIKKKQASMHETEIQKKIHPSRSANHIMGKLKILRLFGTFAGDNIRGKYKIRL
jgi:hypothetical protein